MSHPLNQMARLVARFNAWPGVIRQGLISRLMGRVVPMVGTAGLHFEQLSAEAVVVRIKNRRVVQNHIKGVHAAGMALLAETATGFAVGMHVPDDKLPLIKSMKVSYLRRATGGLQAVARLSEDQVALMHQQDKGEVLVAVTVTDESGQSPIEAEMVWAWVPKQRKA